MSCGVCGKKRAAAPVKETKRGLAVPAPGAGAVPGVDVVLRAAAVVCPACTAAEHEAGRFSGCSLGGVPGAHCPRGKFGATAGPAGHGRAVPVVRWPTVGGTVPGVRWMGSPWPLRVLHWLRWGWPKHQPGCGCLWRAKEAWRRVFG